MSNDPRNRKPDVSEFANVFGTEMCDATNRVEGETGEQLSFYLLTFDADGNIAISSNANPELLKKYLGENLEKLNNTSYLNSVRLSVMEPLTPSIH